MIVNSDSPATRGTVKRLGGQTLFVLIGNAFTLAVGLPLQVYVARVLGAAGLGIYSLIDAGIATASGLAGLGVAQTIVRFIPAHLEKGELASVRGLARTGARILIAVGSAGYVAMVVALPWISSVWPELKSYEVALALMGLMLPLGLVLSFTQQALRAFHDIRYLVFGSSFLQLTIKASVAIVAFSLGFRLEGYVAAIVLSSVCAIGWMAWGLLRRLRNLPLASSVLPKREWRRFAATSYAMSLLSSATGGLDRYLLGFFAGPAAVGVLAVVRQLRQLPDAFNAMLLMVGAPMFAAAHGREDPAARQHLFVIMTDWVVRASLPLLLFLFVFAHPLLTLFGTTFADQGVVALRIFVCGQFFSLAFGPVGNVTLMSGLERFNLGMDVALTSVGALLMVALVPKFGLVGVALASTVAIVVGNVGLMTGCRLILGLRWWDRRYAKWIVPASASLAAALVLHDVSDSFGPVGLAASLIAIYVAFGGVSKLQGLNEDDRELLRHVKERLIGWVGHKVTRTPR